MAFKINGGIDLTNIFVKRSLLAAGTLQTMGQNTNGQLGDNSVTTRSSPVQTVAGGIIWKQVACGTNHTAAVKSDGTLWAWGSNAYGQLGDATITKKSSPVQTTAAGTTWKQVACGQGHTAAVKTDGTLWTWGLNTNYGQLGDNTTASKSSPVQTTAAGTTWKQVACGAYHTAAVKTDGTLWTWGRNSYGQLGDNSVTPRSSPVQTVAGGTTWEQVACGKFHTAAIQSDGTLWAFGQNTSTALGDGTSTNRSSPVQTTAGGTTWKQVAAGGSCTAAIKTDGTLWLWGANTSGQLGDNTRTSRSSPVQTVAGGTTWKQISVGGYFSGAVKTDGTLWMWGTNTTGQLGDGTIAAKSSPVQTVAGGSNWKQVACGNTHAAELTDIDFQ